MQNGPHKLHRQQWKDLTEGTFVSDHSASKIREAVNEAMPEMLERDRSMMIEGICFGLAAAVRFVEATQQGTDRELAGAPVA